MNPLDAASRSAALRPAETPLVSILMPVHRARYLRAALESALRQTYPHLELVICDNDRSGEVEALVSGFAQRDARIRYQRNPVDWGGELNWQRCFELAAGEYCAFLCYDDVLAPFCVERLRAVLQRHPGVTMAYGHTQCIDGDDLCLPDPEWAQRRFPVDAWIQGASLAAIILKLPMNIVGSPSGVLFRRDLLTQVRPAITSFGGHPTPWLVDVALWLNLLSQGDAVCLTDTLCFYRIHAESSIHHPQAVDLSAADWHTHQQTALEMGLLTNERCELVWRPLDTDGAGMANDLDFTGERLVPGKTDPLLELEHVARYRYAAQLAGNGRILDDGCGAGYGTAILAESGATVTGIDVDEAAIAHCRRRYPGPGLDFQTMDSTRLIFPDDSFDAVVSFEVIEHVAAYEQYVREAWRVLRSGGLFIVSTPNKRTYTDDAGQDNPYHVHEFYVDDFRQLLEGVFPSVQLAGQTYTRSLVIGLPGGDPAPFEANWPQIDGLVPSSAEGYLNRSQYLIAVCRKAGPTGFRLPPLPNQVTVLATAPATTSSESSAAGGEPSQSDAGVRFVSGFYHDEGGWRWMGPEGVLVAPAQNLPGHLSFDLTCAAAANYRRFPFQVRIVVDKEVHRVVEFDAGHQTRTVSLPIAANAAGTRVRLVSSQTFAPYLVGAGFDRRVLSVRLGGLAFVSESPNDLSVWLSRAAAADVAGDPAGAETILRQTLRQHPNAPEPYRQLALLLASRQDYPPASELLQRALALAPGDAALNNEYGTLCLLQGDLPGAVTSYQRALDLDPSLKAASANLAACEAYMPPGRGDQG